MIVSTDTPPPPAADPVAPAAAVASPPADSALVCREVRKHFGTTVALDGVSLSTPRGSIFGFLGPNGAGKSTLVKILVGLVRPSAGDVQVLGGRPGTKPVQRNLGYLPEQFRFPPWLTGRELLRFHARLMGTPDEATALLNLTGIGAAGDRRIGGYSKGMQQRLGLAQALVGNPQMVFLDEPTSALDPLGRLEVRDVLLHLRGRGVTVFLNSHLLTEAEKVCDAVAVIDRGRIVAQGPMETLLARPEARVRVGMLTPKQAAVFLALMQEKLGITGGAYEAGMVTAPATSPGLVPQLVQAAVDQGLPVYEAGLARRSLEDAFVELVRRPRPEDEAAAYAAWDAGA